MQTKIIKIDPQNPEYDLIDEAVEILKTNELVAFQIPKRQATITMPKTNRNNLAPSLFPLLYVCVLLISKPKNLGFISSVSSPKS